MFHAPGVHVVALVPVAGPVPPPISVVMPGVKRVGNLIRRDEVHVGIDAASRQDVTFAGENFCRGADFQTRGHAVHDPGITRLANRRDPPVANADVGFVDARPVDDERRSNHQIRRAGVARDRGRLSHSIADHFAAAKLRFVAVDRRSRARPGRSGRCRRGERDRRSSDRNGQRRCDGRFSW